MTATGGGPTTSAGACSPETPCFVCKLQAVVQAQIGSTHFDDTPFVVNLVGVRLANSITDSFDDLMVLFFSLPASKAAKALRDARIEDDLLTDVGKAATAVNGADPVLDQRGVRIVPCSSVALEPGRRMPGQRVVAMFPASTDPGLVRPDDTRKTAKTAIDGAKAAIAAQSAWRAALDKARDDLKALDDDFRAKAAKQTDLVKKHKHDPDNQELKDATQAVKDAKQKIDARVDQLLAGQPAKQRELNPDLERAEAATDKWVTQGKPTDGTRLVTQAEAATDKWLKRSMKATDDSIAKLQGDQKKAEAALAEWSKPELTREEKDHFEGYRGIFLTLPGWEGIHHALFPVGYQQDCFRLHLLHSEQANAEPALTIGEFRGERFYTGEVLARKAEDAKSRSELEKAYAWLLDNAAEPVQGPLDRKRKRLDKSHTQALKRQRTAADREAELTRQRAESAALALETDQALEAVTRESVELVSAKLASGAAPPPAGTWIVLGCEVQTPEVKTPPAPAGKAPLGDDDMFSLQGDIRPRSGREIRLHYFRLTATLGEPDGLVIVAHHPAGEGATLPAGSKIVAKESGGDHYQLMFESDGALQPIAGDDRLMVWTDIGSTNAHRGHSLSVDPDSGNVTGPASPNTSLKLVHDWSTGCQVFPLFADYNLFILLCGLSKRWRCLHDPALSRPTCPRVAMGTKTDPDTVVWGNTSLKIEGKGKGAPARFQDDVVAGIASDQKGLADKRKRAQDDVKSQVDAWKGKVEASFKAQKKKIPTKEDEAEAQAVAWYQDRVATLTAKIAAEKAAAASPDAGGPQAPPDPALAAEEVDLKKQQDDQAALDRAIAARTAVDARIAALDDVRRALLPEESGTFRALETVLEDKHAELHALAPDPDPQRHEPADARKEARDAVAAWDRARDDLLTTLRKDAWERAARMKHDWVRTCDIALPPKKNDPAPAGPTPCAKRYSYTLIELPAQPAAGIQCLDDLVADFNKPKAGGDDDAYPEWNGFTDG